MTAPLPGHERLLQTETVDLDASDKWLMGDTLEVTLAVNNKTGHKFPTAYPSRRAWLYLGIKDGRGDDVFESGKWDIVQNEIQGLDEDYEAHHDMITHPDQVQVYQSLMKDVDR